MADLQPFADIDDLQKFWKNLGSTDQDRATYLLNLASNRLRLIAENSGVDLDARQAASPAYLSTLQWVVMEAVKRAMLTPLDQAPVDTYQQTAGPYSENIKYTNPSGDLWYKRSELAELGLNGKQVMGSISTSRTDIYGS